MRFADTKRNVYTKEKVRKMSFERVNKKPKIEGIPEQFYQQKLGNLQAAGHLKINGFTSFKNDTEEHGQEGNPYQKHTTIINMERYIHKDLGDTPHLAGYLESASNADKQQYRIKGWFNEDGTIRIELVK
jgi:hypothetical protein